MLSKLALAASLLLGSTQSIALSPRQDQTLNVTSPRAGDTFALEGSDDVAVPITWSVPDAIKDRPVLLSFKRGDNVSSLELLYVIDASAPNNGSYTFYGDSYQTGLRAGYSDAVGSACNYTIEAKVWSDVVYSGYFTIINPEDGGLKTDAVCPSAESWPGPANVTFPAPGDDQDNGTSSGGSLDGEAGIRRGAVSITTLIAAMVVPIVVLLAVIAALLWLGMRRGWFARRSASSTSLGKKDNRAGLSHVQKSPLVQTNEGPRWPSELHHDPPTHLADGRPVYQLHGDEESRG